jgi:hypothetical protein
MTQESSSYAYDSWQNAMTPPPANKDAQRASEKNERKKKENERAKQRTNTKSSVGEEKKGKRENVIQ